MEKTYYQKKSSKVAEDGVQQEKEKELQNIAEVVEDDVPKAAVDTDSQQEEHSHWTKQQATEFQQKKSPRHQQRSRIVAKYKSPMKKLKTPIKLLMYYLKIHQLRLLKARYQLLTLLCILVMMKITQAQIVMKEIISKRIYVLS